MLVLFTKKCLAEKIELRHDENYHNDDTTDGEEVCHERFLVDIHIM